MTKKKKDDKVVELVPKQEEAVDPRLTMSQEEIEAFMRQEEEELNAHLNKFLGNIPMPDTSGISEDEEEEIVTLDFDEEGKITATEKVGEGVVARDADGNISEVTDPAIIEMVKASYQPSPRDKYQDMITDRFVSKAIASLVEKLNASMKAVFENTGKGLPTAIGEHLSWEASEVINKQKKELQQAISGGKVYYDRIPVWAKEYVDEYMNNALNTLIDFVERD